MIADIVLYTSFHEELNFPPMLIRAMSFGVPIIAPDMPIIKKNVSRVCFIYSAKIYESIYDCLLLFCRLSIKSMASFIILVILKC